MFGPARIIGLATLFTFAAMPMPASASWPTDGTITTVAGTGVGGFSGDGGPATAAQLRLPTRVLVDPAGFVYFSDYHNNRVRRVNPTTGIITTVAGGAPCCNLGDNGPATGARLSAPMGLAMDSAGNLYIAEYSGHRVRRVAAGTGIITTIAGNGTSGFSGDNGNALAAQLNSPQGVAVDDVGNLYIADTDNNRIRRVTAASGIITTVAGDGTYSFSGDGAAAFAAQMRGPTDVQIDGDGNVYIVDRGNERIRKVTAVTGAISTIVGTGSGGYFGDMGAATSARLSRPESIALDTAGNLYIADYYNHRIRKVDAAGRITTVAGSTDGFGGDGGSATAAQLRYPYGVAVDTAGNLYIADSDNERVRRVAAPWMKVLQMTTLAGSGDSGYAGDGGNAVAARLSGPTRVLVDAAGFVYIADFQNDRVRRVNPTTGIITTVAGGGPCCGLGDNGPATNGRLNGPVGLAMDGAGNLYIADYYNHRIRRVAAGTGVITTVAGNGTAGFSGDNGPALAAQLRHPHGVALDGSGNLYIADTDNNRIRKVTASTGVIATFAGDGAYGFAGDGAAAFAAQMRGPTDVQVDGGGNVYIVDRGNERIRRVTAATGNIATIAGTGTSGYSGDMGAATSARMNRPQSIALDKTGNLYVADFYNHRIRMIAVNGRITTIAGGSQGFGGDVGSATAGQLSYPEGVAVDWAGNVYVADTNNQRVRKARAGVLPPPPFDFWGLRYSSLAVYRAGTWFVHGRDPVSWGAPNDVPVAADYDGDGVVDIGVWRPSNGTWYVRGQFTIQYGTRGDLPVPGDYNGDGRAEVAVWRPSTGTWFVAGQAPVQFGTAGDVPVPGDYDGNGRMEPAVYRPSQATWFIAGRAPVIWGGPQVTPVPADYNGDGITDIAVFDRATGEWAVKSGAHRTFGVGTDIPTPLDVDGDGRAEFCVFRPSTGTWYALNPATDGVVVAAYGTSGDVPIGTPFAQLPRFAAAIRGDVDGDGAVDLTVFRPSLGMWYSRLSGSGFVATTSSQWGAQGDVIVSGDYSRAGRSQVAVFRPSTGQWFVQGGPWLTWGTQGDVPVPGDYDGDGLTDIAVWRPATGWWYILTSRSGFTGMLLQNWGAAGDAPVAEDVDGDGKADLGVFRAGSWYVRLSSTNYTTYLERRWGTSGDVPVAADYDGDGRADLAVWRPATGVWFVLTSRSAFREMLPLVQWGSGPAGDVAVPGDYNGDGVADIAVFRAATGTWHVLGVGSFQWGAATDVPSGKRP